MLGDDSRVDVPDPIRETAMSKSPLGSGDLLVNA